MTQVSFSPCTLSVLTTVLIQQVREVVWEVLIKKKIVYPLTLSQRYHLDGLKNGKSFKQGVEGSYKLDFKLFIIITCFVGQDAPKRLVAT